MRRNNVCSGTGKRRLWGTSVCCYRLALMLYPRSHVDEKATVYKCCSSIRCAEHEIRTAVVRRYIAWVRSTIIVICPMLEHLFEGNAARCGNHEWPAACFALSHYQRKCKISECALDFYSGKWCICHIFDSVPVNEVDGSQTMA